MPDIDAILEEPARRFYDAVASGDQRRRLDAIIGRLRSDPAIDGVTTFAFNVGVPETDARIYFDDEFRIVYRMINEWTLSIINVGLEDEPPRSP